MIDLGLPLAFGYLLVLLRTAGLMLAAPIFSATMISARLRLAIAAGSAAAIFAGAGMPQVAPPSTLLALAGAGLAETFVGAAAGLCARFLISAAEAAGSIAGLSAGLGYGALVDPFNGAASSVGGQLLNLLALGIAIAANLHGEAVGWLARSVAEHPPGVAFDMVGLVTTLVTTAIYACVLSIRLAFPFLAASLRL